MIIVVLRVGGLLCLAASKLLQAISHCWRGGPVLPAVALALSAAQIGLGLALGERHG